MANLDYTPNEIYTQDGFIAASPGLHGELQFTYRPFLMEDRARYMVQVEKLPLAQQYGKAAAELGKRLASWSLENPDGTPLKITTDNVRRVKPALLDRLWLIVLGIEASDIDPQWDTEQTEEHVEAIEEAAAAPAPIGDVLEEKAAKNSNPG